MYIYFQHLTFFLQKASTATLQEIFQIKITAECFIVVIVLGELCVTFITPVLPTVLFITQRIRPVEALVQVCYITILLFLIEETVCVETLMVSLCKIW